MNVSKPYKKVGKPVDSTWMKEMSTCFDPEISLNHLPDHLCVRDCTEIIQSKINCAETALVVLQDVLATAPTTKVGHTDIRSNRNSRFYEAVSSDDESEDFYSMPAFKATYGSVNDKKANEDRLLQTLKAFSKAIPYCYPCTYHLMCKDWHHRFPSTLISYCPLCPAMKGWRKKHNLVIDNTYLCYHADDKSKKIKKSLHNH